MRSRTPLALMEQTVMVLVFALAAVLCLRVFVWSDLESKRGETRDRAAVAAQNAAESIRHVWADGEDGTETDAGDKAGGGGVTGAGDEAGIGGGDEARAEIGEFTVYYDRDWNEVGGSGSAADIPGEAAYILTMRGTDTGIDRLAAAHVAVTEKKSGEVLFELDTAWQKEAVR